MFTSIIAKGLRSYVCLRIALRAYTPAATIQYVQGQSPEPKVREYFYYIDHEGMVSVTLDKLSMHVHFDESYVSYGYNTYFDFDII